MIWESRARFNKNNWHPWFAWFPVRLPDNRLEAGVWVWWQWIERQTFCPPMTCYSNYRLPKRQADINQ